MARGFGPEERFVRLDWGNGSADAFWEIFAIRHRRSARRAAGRTVGGRFSQ